MTREESLEALCVAFEKLDEDEQRGMIRLIEQMKRAHTFGLDVRFDEHTFTFFIADAATNTVVAPPRMLIAFLENNLNADGSVNIPEALRPYMGGKEKIGG